MTDWLSEGVMRKADVALRTNGGRCVLLRMPGPASSGDDAEQLGLAMPTFNDIDLAPAVFHKANNVTRLLVSGSAVSSVVQSMAFDSADALFETAVGIVIDDVLYEIVNNFSSQSRGEAYCWWLELKLPVR